MTTLSPLLAKSYDSSHKVAPSYAQLVPHLKAVERAGESIVEICGPLILEQVGLSPDVWLLRLQRAIKTACVCHDLGKANDGFQQMVRGKLNPLHQPARHELLSALLLMDRHGDIGQWACRLLERFPGDPDVDMLLNCVIGAVAGHHLKVDQEWKRSALALRGGCGLSLKLMLSHPDLRPLFRDFVCSMDTSFSLIEGDPNYLGLQHMPFCKESYKWESALAAEPEWSRFAAILKGLVAAADVAGSAMLPDGGATVIRQWVHHALSNRVAGSAMLEVVDARLRGKELRKFQKDIGSADARVTLVEAGCGSGKTAAAYLWAARHAHAKKLFFCYPTTGTATEGFLGYVHETEVEARLIHSRAIVDLEGLAEVSDDEDDDHCLRIESLNAWSPQVIVCTADVVLAMMRSNRRGLYNSPAILSGAFVFDELHAYDNKMFEALIALVRLMPKASFLLMTASLPSQRKKFLLDNIDQVHEIPPPADLEDIPRYEFNLLSSQDEALALAGANALNEQRVLWITNTVGRAQEVLELLLVNGVIGHTYHSRFKYMDRVEQHHKVINAFANESSGGVVAVTTQVAEMSLDLDAHVLISEIAPIPSLIQRLGRLNRRVSADQPGRPRAAFFLEPKRSSPYKPEELAMARAWLNELAELGRPLRQRDLSDCFNRRHTAVEVRLDTRTALINSGWFAVPESVREGGQSVSVILSEDLEICKGDARELIKRCILMNYHVSMKGWTEFRGNLVAPMGVIDYRSYIGAVMQ